MDFTARASLPACTYRRTRPTFSLMTDLNYERRGVSDESGAGALVLIHGIGSRWQMWTPVLDRLAAEKDVIALDLPGFGLSPPLPAHGPAGIGALADAVEDLTAGLGVERPHVAGNSLGGWVALELARRGSVRSATAFSPAGFASRMESVWSTASLRSSRRIARWLSPGIARLAPHRWFRRVVYAQMVAHPGSVSPVEIVESTRALANATGFEATLRALHRDRFRLGGPVDAPVTVAWGARDRLLWPRQAARAAAEIPGAQIVKLPGCGHIPTYDDPELVARVILETSARAG